MYSNCLTIHRVEHRMKDRGHSDPGGFQMTNRDLSTKSRPTILEEFLKVFNSLEMS